MAAQATSSPPEAIMATPTATLANAPTDHFIAATLRDARRRMKEINKKRQRLQTEISQQPSEQGPCLEGQYWQKSQARLEKVMNDDPSASIRVWGRRFALDEKQFLDDVLAQRSLDAVHEQHASIEQEELMAADREFWGIWRKQLDFLGDLPPQAVADDIAGQPQATNTGSAVTSPAATKKRKISAQPGSRPVLTLATPASEASDAHGHSLSPTTTQTLMSIATQPPRSPGPFGAPSPISLASSPDPTIPPSGVFSKPQYPASKRRKTTAAAAEPNLKSAFTPINSPLPSPQPLPSQQQQASPATKSNQQDSDFQGVTDLVVGETYQAYYKDANQEGWWMCTPMPWDDWEGEIGIDMDFTRADMWRDIPKQQYKAGKGRRKKAILGWKGQYQDGGNKVTQRIFPVLFFDDEEGAPGNLQFPSLDETYVFPEKAMEALPVEWVAAKNVKVAGGDIREVHGAVAARRFRDRFLARKARREEGR